MTAATGRVFGPKPFAGTDGVLPASLYYPLGANVAPFRNWLMGHNGTAAVAEAAGVTNLVSLGFSDRDDASSATSAAAFFLARCQFVSGFVQSTVGSDAILATDVCTPCWAVDNETVGKKSNNAGVNRSLLGLAFGVDPDNNTAIIYPGPIGWTLARATLLADAAQGANYAIADAAANTATAERAIPRAKLHGKVTAITFTGAAVTASDTDNAVITISKRDGAGGAAVSLGTYSTAVTGGAAITAFTPAAFTLSVTASDLDLLETDIVTITITKGGAGKVLTGAFNVYQKVG